MMSRLGIAVLLAALGFPSATAWAQKSVRYPRVYGATGRPYGPTQAHYQYQRQYGRPWHGYGGINANSNAHLGHQFVNGYPGAYLSSYGYDAYYNYGGYGLGYGGVFPSPFFSPFPSYTPPVPPVIYGYPPVVGYNPLTDPALNVPRLRGDLGLNPPLDADPVPGANPPLPPISTPEAKLKSVRAQAQGDIWFQQQEFHKAFDRYKTAVSEAPDRGEAHLRLAIGYAALGHLDLAARQLKRGVAVDPQLAAKADSLEKIYGSGNSIAQAAMVNKVTLWAKDDIRDPDRLFLLGVLLYLQGDERAKILLETGRLLAGGGDHFRSFLVAAQNHPIDPPDQAAAGPEALDQDQDPAPQSRESAPPDSEELPALPAPPESTPDDSNRDTVPASGPDLPSPNR